MGAYMRQLLLRLVRRALTYDLESDRLRRDFGGWRAAQESMKVLDVGCGYGRNLRMLREMGCDVKGVDVNQHCIDELRAAGYDCVRPEELGPTVPHYDAVLMAHVIEHFAPADLLAMLDSYLDRLKPGGRLVVLTPLMSPYFYDDFDHVKPYHVTGLLMAFGTTAAQIQYRSRNMILLEDFWIRRTHYKRAQSRAVLLRTPARHVTTAVELAFVLAFRLSGYRLGRKDAWMGVFRKVPTAATAQVAAHLRRK
jgi:2-polyprenyl-3-methyl-5-hydroxy-6-metoxy-1,4-benzoquinol methylase